MPDGWTPIAGGWRIAVSSSGRPSIPRYYAVWRVLWSRIMSGTYPAGSLLGTEVDLAREFGVSRVTVREALSLLERDGLIDRRRSVGTFVSPDVEPRGVFEFSGYIEDVILQAGAARTSWFESTVAACPAHIARVLEIPTGDPVLQVQRLRTDGDSLPRIWLTDFLPAAIGAMFSEEQMRDGSLLQLLDGGTERRISHGYQTVSASIGTAEVCRRLEIAEGAIVLQSDRVSYGHDGRPLGCAQMFYPADRFEFTIRLGRI